MAELARRSISVRQCFPDVRPNAGLSNSLLDDCFSPLAWADAEFVQQPAAQLFHPVKPREWFLVPLHVIDEAVRRIRDRSITEVVYDPKTARLVG